MITAASATDQLLNLGLPGLVILALVGAIVYLRIQNERLSARIEELHAQRLSDRDLRLSDQQANTRVLLEVHDETEERLKILDKAIDQFQSRGSGMRPRT